LRIEGSASDIAEQLRRQLQQQLQQTQQPQRSGQEDGPVRRAIQLRLQKQSSGESSAQPRIEIRQLQLDETQSAPRIAIRALSPQASIQSSVVNGRRRVNVQDGRRSIKLTEDAHGVSLMIAESKDGGVSSLIYSAANLDELHARHPDAFHLYERLRGEGFVKRPMATGQTARPRLPGAIRPSTSPQRAPSRPSIRPSIRRPGLSPAAPRPPSRPPQARPRTPNDRGPALRPQLERQLKMFQNMSQDDETKAMIGKWLRELQSSSEGHSRRR
jgi:hypothetical protein